MEFNYSVKAHIKYCSITLLRDVLLSSFVTTALSVSLLWIIGWQISWPFNYDMFRLTFYFPILCAILYAAYDTRIFLQQRMYESNSELRIELDQAVPLEITIQKEVYRILYHVHSVTDVKKTWKGIVVKGSIAADISMTRKSAGTIRKI